MAEMMKDMPWSDIVASGLIIALLLFARWAISRAIRRDSETLTAAQRKWLSTTQNVTIALIVIGLLVVWSLELSKFALSLAAFAVAIVIGSKEIIMCLTGGLYRATTQPFEVGDWIEVGPFRGEVLSEGLMSTRLQELTPIGSYEQTYTGHDMTMPNALLLLHPVIDLNFRKQFVFHSIVISLLETEVTTEEDLTFLSAAAEKEWAVFKDEADAYLKTVRRRSGVDFKHSAPQVSVHTTDLCHVQFVVSMFCPRAQATALQTRLTTAMLSRIEGRRKKGEA